jgi:hypothetical protein
MEGWRKERYNKDENNKLEGLHQKPDQMEEIRWENQNFSEDVAPQEEEEEEEEEEYITAGGHTFYKYRNSTNIRNFAFSPWTAGTWIPGSDSILYICHTPTNILQFAFYPR